MEVGPGYSATTYLIATQDLGRGLRLHFGGATSGASKSALLGIEMQVGERDYLLADYASWPAGYTSFGLYHEVCAGLGVNLAYAWPNAQDESDLVMLNVSWTHALR
jgi:hypothetical protein